MAFIFVPSLLFMNRSHRCYTLQSHSLHVHLVVGWRGLLISEVLESHYMDSNTYDIML